MSESSSERSRHRIDFEAEVQAALEENEDEDSHVELDPDVFHPSQLVRCDRRAYCSKLGLDDQSGILGVFQTGTLIHEFIEEQLGDRYVDEAVGFEREVEQTDLLTGIKIKGHADCVDFRNNVVYDFKTRNGWYNFEPPVQRHCDQLHAYMAAIKGVERARVVYLSKGDMEVRQWPEDSLFSFDEERYDALMDRAVRIRDAIEENGVSESADEIPFEKCDCYFCKQETLRFDQGDGDE